MKKTSTLIIIAVVLIGSSFYGGMVYGKGQAPSTTAGARFAAGVGGARGMRGAGAGGGFTGGQIISKDATSLTVGVQAGGSKIVFITPTTPVMKTVLGAIGDLTIGENVTVTGTANPDGSISATGIQIRPATTTRAQ